MFIKHRFFIFCNIFKGGVQIKKIVYYIIFKIIFKIIKHNQLNVDLQSPTEEHEE